MNDEFWFFQVWSTSKIPFAGLYILGRLSGINWLKLQSRNSTSPMSASTSSWAASSPPTAWLSSANTSATVCTGKCRNFQFEYQRKSETVNALLRPRRAIRVKMCRPVPCPFSACKKKVSLTLLEHHVKEGHKAKPPFLSEGTKPTAVVINCNPNLEEVKIKEP